MVRNSGRATSELHGSSRVVEYKVFIHVTKSQVKWKSMGAFSVVFQANDSLAREKLKTWDYVLAKRDFLMEPNIKPSGIQKMDYSSYRRLTQVNIYFFNP